MSWQDETARRIADEVRRLRGERSAQWLSDRTAELGRRVSRTTISELEIGKRSRIEVVELVVLAEALEVPPVMLLYPGAADGRVEYLPAEPVETSQAIAWFTGSDLSRYPYENVALAHLVREEVDTRSRLTQLRARYAVAAAQLAALDSGDESRAGFAYLADTIADTIAREEAQLESLAARLRDHYDRARGEAPSIESGSNAEVRE